MRMAVPRGQGVSGEAFGALQELGGDGALQLGALQLVWPGLGLAWPACTGRPACASLDCLAPGRWAMHVFAS